MPTPAEAKQTAYTIAALLAEQAEQLRALETIAGGMAAQAQVIENSAAAVRALADAIIVPPVPVIVVKRGGIFPDKMPGANDTQKVDAAAQEAIERNLPLAFDRWYVRECLELDERYDGIRFARTKDEAGLVLPDVPSGVGAWGWQFFFHPKPGKTMRVSGTFTAHGNRDKAARAHNTTTGPNHTQHGVVLGGYYDSGPQGKVIADFSDVRSIEHDMSGFAVFSELNEFTLRRYYATGNGGSGLDVTRITRGALYDCLSEENGGYQFNPSNGALVEFFRCVARNGGRGRGRPVIGKPIIGGGIKISNRGDGSVACLTRLEDVEIYGNVGTALTSTNAPAGSRVVGGRVTISGNCGHALNFTDGMADVEIDTLICQNGLSLLPSDVADPNYQQPAIDADVLLFGGGNATFGDVVVRGSRQRGIAGGWGSLLTIEGTATVEDCGGAGLTWRDATLRRQEGAIVSRNNGEADSLSINLVVETI